MPFKCEKCSHVFDSHSKLTQHLNKRTPCISNKNAIGKIKCEFCNNGFSSQSSLKRHKDRCVVRKDPKLLLEYIERQKVLNDEKDEIIAQKNELIVQLKATITEINTDKPVPDKVKLTDTESKELIQNGNYIYIIKEREFIKTNENVYKIGQTKKGHYKRTSQYPKGSVVMALIKVPHSVSYETDIKKIFNKKFKQRKDIGFEYYEEDFQKMHKRMLRIIFKLNDEYKKKL